MLFSSRLAPRCRVLPLLVAVLWLSLPGLLRAQDEQKNQAAARDFNAAAALQNTGLYDRSAAKWTAFLKKYPDDKRLDRVHYYLGICQLHEKKYPEALQALQTVLTKYPQFKMLDGAQYNLAMVHYQMAGTSKKPEDYKTAAAAFAVVPTKYPQSKYADRALYFQGDALYMAGTPEAAADVYKKLIAGYPKSPLLPDTYYALGTIQQQDLKLDADAVATFQAFLANAAFAEHELANEIRLRQGMSLFNLAKYDEAEKLLTAVAAVPKFPNADFALLRVGQCKLESGKPAEAVTVFNEVLTKYPESAYKAAAQLCVGKCYFRTDKFAEAQTALQASLQAAAAAKGPEAPEAAYYLAKTLMKLAKPQEALTMLDQAIKTAGEGPFAPYLQMARVDALYELPDRRKETPALYEALFKQYAADPIVGPEALYKAAAAALGQADYATARKHAEVFLADAKLADHESVPAVLFVAAEGYLLALEAEGQGGDLAKSEGYYRTLVTKYPEYQSVPRANLRIAFCLHEAKKYEDALKHLTAVLPTLKDPALLAEGQLLIGRCHSALGREKEAVAAFDAALAAKPDWPRADEVLVASAQSLRALENGAEAAKRLNQLLTAFPQSTYRPHAIYLLGELAQADKKYDDAIARYKEAIAQFPMSQFVALARYGLGASYFAKEDYTNALPPLGELLAAKPDPELLARGQYLRGLTYQRLKQFEPALKDLQAFLEGKPEGEEALDARYAMALCQVGLKQLEPAVAQFQSLLKDKPDFVHADKVYYELGHTLIAMDKPAEATEVFSTLATKLPDSPLAPESFFHVGRFHEEASDKLEAEPEKLAEVTKAAQAYAAGLAKAKAPELAEKLQYKLGDMLFRQKKYEEAAAALEAQVKAHPEGALVGPGRYLAAESYFRLNQFEKALPLFVAVATAKVENYQDHALYRAGACAGNLKNWPQSQQHFAALIAQFPKFEQISEARYGLALALQNQVKLAEARQLYEQVTTETDNETAAKARFMVGEIAFAEKKYEDAIEQYLAVAVGYPYKEWQGLARFETGRCFMELGQKDKALASLELLVEKFPEHAKVADANKLIAELKK